MSFRKIQLISPWDIGCPETGHIYFGRDSVGLWEKFSDCSWHYVTTGGTSASGTSGSSGQDGTSGVNGDFYGSSGLSGSSGKDGTSGSSGLTGKDGINGTSGTSGLSGTSGTSGISGSSGTSGLTGSSGTSGLTGTSGSSGSSGKDGIFFGSSGSSGYSGGYGGASRKWTSTTSATPGTSGFHGTSTWASSYDFTLLDRISINKTDADGTVLTEWLKTWNTGILKIENRKDSSNFGLYDIYSGYTTSGNIYIFTGFTARSGYGSIVNGQDYLISFIAGGTGPTGLNGSSGVDGIFYGSSGISGSSGSSGTSGETGSSGTSGETGSSGTSGSSTPAGLIEMMEFEFRDLNTTTGQTYIYDLKAVYGYTIDTITLQGDTGTGKTDYYINTTKIAGLTGITFNTDIQTYTATGDNTVSINNIVKCIITELSSTPTLIRGVIKTTRT